MVNTTYAPVPTINQTGNMYEIFNFVAVDVTGGLLWVILMWIIYIVALIGNLSEGKSFSRSIIFASFLTSILGGIVALLGWIDKEWVWFWIVLLGIGLLMNRVER